MFWRLIRTTNDPTLTVIRLVVGIVFFAHGAQKALGWFGGPGFTAMMANFQQSGIPAVFAFLAICAEFLGGLGLIFGFLGRIAAFGIMCNMAVAIATVHWPHGFFMNWMGTQSGEGFEYHLLALASCFVILVKGSGAFSIDLLLSRTRRSGRASAEERAA
jgi:putative oxidoreductase